MPNEEMAVEEAAFNKMRFAKQRLEDSAPSVENTKAIKALEEAMEWNARDRSKKGMVHLKEVNDANEFIKQREEKKNAKG